MPPDNVNVSSQQSSTGEYSIAPQLLIEYHISDDLPPLHINFPLSEIASPTKDDDPESTEFARDWQKTILIKTFRKIEKQLARRKLLTNNHHFDELKTMLNFPNIDKKTFDEHFMISIASTNAGVPIEIYASQFLKTIRDFYIGKTPGGIIHINLELTGLPYTLLEDAFLMSSPTLRHDAEPTSTNASSTLPEIPTSSSTIPPTASAAPVPTPTTSISVSPNATLVTPPQDVLHASTVTNNADTTVATNADDSTVDNSHNVNNHADIAHATANADDPTDNIHNTDTRDATVNVPSDPPTAAVALHPAFQRVNGIRSTTPTTILRRPTATPPDPSQTTRTMTPQINSWDSFERSNVIHTDKQYIKSRKNKPATRAAYSNVLAWTKARFNPDSADAVIDPATGQFVPWCAHHPERGAIDCFPVPINNVFMIQDLFMTRFNSGPGAVGYLRYNPKYLKEFQDAFPPFGPEDVLKYFHWHNRLVTHASQYGFYIPPAHTLRAKEILGVWFLELPPHVQADTQNHFCHVLTGCLRKHMQTSVRTDHPFIADIIQHGSDNGYKILHTLAQQAGQHPLLIRNPFDPSEPVQDNDTTVIQYVVAWQQYLRHMLLDGTVYSDRYFLQQFLRNLHKSIREKIGPHLRQSVAEIPITSPLPDSFAPDTLATSLKDLVSLYFNPAILAKTPRHQYSSSDVRAINYQQIPASTLDVDDDFDLPALVAALNSNLGQCYLCESDGHRFAQCPIYTRLSDNPRAITSLIRDLQRRKPKSSRPPKHIRQVDLLEAGEGNSFVPISAGEGNDIDDTSDTNISNHDDNPLLDFP
jgi:hypothetical protein